MSTPIFGENVLKKKAINDSKAPLTQTARHPYMLTKALTMGPKVKYDPLRTDPIHDVTALLVPK
uniref:Uncharacterized protein n=1 Tax=Arion vulgaris TaxID=1028688 RepID=A0A0B7B475_9EUPU